MATTLHGILCQSKESLTEDVVLKSRELSQRQTILKWRQIVWMMLDYFKTNRTLQEQCKYQDLESLKLMGDEKLQNTHKRWQVITTGMVTPLADSSLCDILLDRICPSKKLQANINEFDRFREDDPRNNIRWLTDSIDRLGQRERMLNARAMQHKADTVWSFVD